ncbi:MAG: thiol-activated cytolysin family protein, partial [Bacteroidota bacterium]
DVRTKYNELLQNVEISYKLLGGQWEPFSHTNDINEIIKEYNEINKRISTGSTVRNGVPIAYEVKYVKNNNSAAVGQATKYKETKCKIVDDYISHETAGLFTAVYRVTAGDGTVVYDKKFKRDEGRKIKVDLPLSLPDPLTLEINLRSILKPLSAKGGWSFFWEGQITRGCHYRMGGSSINQADLVIQECDEN